MAVERGEKTDGSIVDPAGSTSRVEPTATSIAGAEWWRAVLGEYPTGVCLITSTGPDGDPIGMVVGSFVAVSQDPPLIGFFGDGASVSFRQIIQVGRFTVSVLGDSHEAISRAFIRKDADRFARTELVAGTDGVPRVGDAAAWFEASIVSVDRHGDHQLVVGEVADFGIGSANSGLPLIYRRGGYGSFAVPSDAIDPIVLGDRLAAASAAGGPLAAVAREVARDIAITTVVGESVVVLAIVRGHEAAPGRPRPRVMDDRDPLRPIGIAFPFAAPVEPLFAAWGSERVRRGWIEQSRHLVGKVDRDRLEARLAEVRGRGYSLSVDRDLTERFYSLVSDRAAERESYARVWSDFAAQTLESTAGQIPVTEVASIEVPVFDSEGSVVLGLTVSDLEPFENVADLDRFARHLMEAARSVTELIGGRLPEGFARPD